MHLIKLIVAIQYSDVPDGLDYGKKILNILTDGNQPNIKTPFAQALELKVEAQRMFIAVSGNKTGIELNQPQNENEAVKQALLLFEKLNGQIQWKKIVRIGVRSMWIKTFDTTFSNLIKIFKEKVYQDCKIISQAEDVGVHLTFKDKENMVNFISGPMNKKQLAELFLPPAPFDKDKLPDTFAFVDADYFTIKELEYSPELLRTFIKIGIDYSRNKAHKLFQALG